MGPKIPLLWELPGDDDGGGGAAGGGWGTSLSRRGRCSILHLTMYR